MVVNLLKRVYPCSSFWRTFHCREKEFTRTSSIDSQGGIHLRIFHSSLFSNLTIDCGEIDGVVLGSWATSNGYAVVPEVDNANTHAVYWAAAAVWCDCWDQRTVDRVSRLLFLSCFSSSNYPTK